MTDSGYGLLDVIQSAGVVGILVVIVTAFLRGWVVTRQQFLDVAKERDAWRSIALKGTKVGEDVVEVLKGLR